MKGKPRPSVNRRRFCYFVCGGLSIIISFIFSILYIAKSWRFSIGRIFNAPLKAEPKNASKFIASMNWSRKWWLDLDPTLPFPKSNPQCPLCNFTPTQIAPSSTESDVVVTVAIDKIYGLPTFIKSLRTSQINSAVVVLADSSAAKRLRDLDTLLLKPCGVTLIDVGILDTHQLKGRYRTRWHLVYDLLRFNPHNFARFVMTDAYDSFFQGDVFLANVSSERIYFSTESLNIGGCPHNQAWIREVFGSALNSMMNHPIICAGPIIGGIAPFLKVCEAMFALEEWPRKWSEVPDQAYVNYVVRMGILANRGIDFEIVKNDGFITTVGYCDRKGALMVDANGNIGCPGFKTTPMLLHQYFRPRNMRPHVQKVCPSGGMRDAFKMDPYSKASF
jgi:hypothetical protein